MVDVVSNDIVKAKKLHQKKIEEQKRFARQSQTLQHKMRDKKQIDKHKTLQSLTSSQNAVHTIAGKIGRGLYYLGVELKKIKTKQLYMAQNFETFDDYCKLEMSINPIYAHNLILVCELLTLEQAMHYGIELSACVMKKSIRDRILKLIERDVDRNKNR